MPERLLTLRNFIFKDGVVEKNDGCSAAFYESAALRAGSWLALSVTAYSVPPLPKGEALAKPGTLWFDRELCRHAKGSPFGRAGA